MPTYTFFMLVEGEETHSRWRGAESGSMQYRIRFREKSAYRLTEDEMHALIVEAINSNPEKNRPGEWMVQESDTRNRYMFEILPEETWGWW